MKDPKVTFETKDEALLAAQQFEELKKHMAWGRIYKFMVEKLKYFDWLLKEGKISSLDELERIRDRIRLTEQFMNLPDIIVEIIKRNDGQEMKFDPYATTTEKTFGEADPYPQHLDNE